MSVENLDSPSNPIELLKKMPPEKFTQACDIVMDFQINDNIFYHIVYSVEEGHLVGAVTNHQSYFEIEAERKMAQEVNRRSKNPINFYLTYSEPATVHNAGELLNLRQPIYKENHLILLPIIRKSDKDHPIYSLNITEGMEKRSHESKETLHKIMKEGGCVLIIPFEGNLDGGRKNVKTGKRNGMQQMPKDEVLLKKILRHDVDILPLSIDGSFKVLDPDNHHQPTSEFINAFLGHPSKLVTVKADEFIKINTRYRDLFKMRRSTEIADNIAVKIAKNLSPETRGYYGQFVEDCQPSDRTDLEKI